MAHFRKLVGEKVYLSPLDIEDAEKYVKWFCDMSLTDGLGKSRDIDTIESEKEWLRKSAEKRELNFGIVSIETDKLIGNCGFLDIDNRDRIATIGIFIGDEENRSKGYGTDTLKLLLDYGFNYQNFNNIMLCVESFNERAIACYKKVGFKEIGRRREGYFLNGKYYDDVYMDILAREYKESHIKNKNI